MEGSVIVHKGTRYWDTYDLVASLEHRGLIAHGGGRYVRYRRAQRWAQRNALAPAATTKRGGLLYREDDYWRALGVSLAGVSRDEVDLL